MLNFNKMIPVLDMAANRRKKWRKYSCINLTLQLNFHNRSCTKLENVRATVAFYHYLVVTQYNFIMDANTELKPQDLLKEILKKNSKTEHNY